MNSENWTSGFQVFTSQQNILPFFPPPHFFCCDIIFVWKKLKYFMNTSSQLLTSLTHPGMVTHLRTSRTLPQLHWKTSFSRNFLLLIYTVYFILHSIVCLNTQPSFSIFLLAPITPIEWRNTLIPMYDICDNRLVAHQLSLKALSHPLKLLSLSFQLFLVSEVAFSDLNCFSPFFILSKPTLQQDNLSKNKQFLVLLFSKFCSSHF